VKAILSFLLCAGIAHAAYDVNDVTLGATEKEIKEKFPYANCRVLEWPSRAADRRCDDSRIIFAGVDASVTFYLRKGTVEGFDVRFDHRDTGGIVKFLSTRYGAPTFEGPGPVVAQWTNKTERATTTSGQGRRRASLLVSRGTFEDEIYKVR
jgi:hypothetical protein